MVRRTVYISGPMRGRKDHNFPAFFRAEAKLLREGWQVLNPARIDMEEDGFDSHGKGPAFPIDHFIRRDLDLIMGLKPGRDAIAVLDDWFLSYGARAEVYLAKWRGLRVFYVSGGEVV